MIRSTARKSLRLLRLGVITGVLGCVTLVALTLGGGPISTGQRDPQVSGWSLLRRKAAQERSSSGSLQSLAHAINLWRGDERRLPSKVRRQVERSLGGPTEGLRFQHAHYARIGRARLWLLAGRGIGCLVRADTGSLTCNTVRAIRHQGLSLGTFTAAADGRHAREFQLIGVAPNGVGTVEIKAGRVRLIDVTHNTFTYNSDRPIFVIRLLR